MMFQLELLHGLVALIPNSHLLNIKCLTAQQEQSKAMAQTSVPHKELPDSIYIHGMYLSDSDPRVSELVLRLADENELRYPADYNVVKIYKDLAKISFLHYENFFEDPFPKLKQSLLVDIEKKEIKTRRYGVTGNQPILHRKELLLGELHPEWSRFADLTERLEELGLFQDAKSIGYDQQWQRRLEEAGVSIDDHSIIEKNEPGQVYRHKTAIKRYSFSSPFQSLNKFGYLAGDYDVFDFGCGHGDDLKILAKIEVPASGWDPYHNPDAALTSADIVNLGFVLNVIEDPTERMQTLRQAHRLAKKVLVVSVMLTSQNSGGTQFGDGVRTSRNTFQKYYTQAEMREYLSETLETEPIAVGSGIFFVFTDKIEEQRFLERRYRSSHLQVRSGAYLDQAPKARPLSRSEKEQLFIEENSIALKAFEENWYQLGRKPLQTECKNAAELIGIFGSFPKAANFLEKIIDPDAFQTSQKAKVNDLLVYFAMCIFERRKTYSVLPQELRQDVKVFFNNLQDAMVAGQKLLFQAGNSDVVLAACQNAEKMGLGNINQEDQFQFHVSMFDRLESVLQVYIYCGSILYGDYDQADLVKIHPRTLKITFIKYDDFDNSPLPRMIQRVKVDLARQRIDYFSYGEEYPSPYLFNKSRYITEDYPRYHEQLEFDNRLSEVVPLKGSEFGPDPAQLDAVLEKLGYEIKGFDLAKSTTIPNLNALCGNYLTFRDLIAAGVTFEKSGIPNIPKQPETYDALRDLTRVIIDPVIEYFGEIVITYGFCSRQLAAQIPGRIDPKRDQHASHELNTKGNLICPRLGAAIDFLVEDESMLDVAKWLIKETEFDRIYFYGDNRPIHVSVGPEAKREVVVMKCYDGKMVPKVVGLTRFLDFTIDDF